MGYIVNIPYNCKKKSICLKTDIFSLKPAEIHHCVVMLVVLTINWNLLMISCWSFFLQIVVIVNQHGGRKLFILSLGMFADVFKHSYPRLTSYDRFLPTQHFYNPNIDELE